MKKLVLLLALCPLFIWGNDNTTPSKIKDVTVYLSGAQITREAEFHLKEGTSELVFDGLSHKIDESSIQLSGLQSVSILSISYDINYLSSAVADPKVAKWTREIGHLQSEVTLLKNLIAGLEEEEKVITTNRLVSSDNQTLDLEKIKEISKYYRQRITEIKNEIFKTNLEIIQLNTDILDLKKQLQEVNNLPEKEQGEIRIKFDAQAATTLDLILTYNVNDAGWIPNYDIKSDKINDPLHLAYKAHVYQNTGNDWKNVNITLSTGNPNIKILKPNLGAKYLNFLSRYAERRNLAPKKKQRYVYNPSVRSVAGMVTDESGLPIPGANIIVKGTTTGTTTDFDGYFTLNIQGGQELVFSTLGYNSQQLAIYSSIMNVQLEQDAMALNEVVAMGYTNGSNITNTLQGKTVGINIRGTSSIPTSNLSLYVVDGMPVSDFVEGDLDESEIQSIEVLKGANASAIYGARGSNGVVVITTKKSSTEEDVTNTKFVIKKPYSITSDGDITAIEINTFKLKATYEYFAAPIVDENVFLTATFSDWEQYNLLPGEANIYFAGSYSGKTTLDPYTVKKEMVLSLGTDPNITVARKQNKNFKRKSFTGSNRVLDRVYELEVKNNKAIAVNLKLMDRIPLSQNKEIKVDDIVTNSAEYDKKKGLLTWKLKLGAKESKTEAFSFQVKYPKYKTISL